MDCIVVGFDGTRSSSVAVGCPAERAARGPCRVEIGRIDSAGLMAEDVEWSAFDEAERRLRNIAPDAEVTSRTVDQDVLAGSQIPVCVVPQSLVLIGALSA